MDPDYCLICNNYSLDRDDENFIIGTNPIIYCTYCNIGVHLKCVGLNEIPEPFVCDKCLFLRKGGDPSQLVCAFCPSRYGYLFACKRRPDEMQQFCHLHCALFSDGGTVLSFAKVSLSNPSIDVSYMNSPTVPTTTFPAYSVSLLQPVATHSSHVKSAQRMMRAPIATPSPLYIPHSFNLAYSAIKISYKTEAYVTHFSSFREDALVEAENRYKLANNKDASYRHIFPTLPSPELDPSSFLSSH